MRRQPFAAFALLTASVGMTSLTAFVPSAVSAEPEKKEAIRTDRYGDPLPKGPSCGLAPFAFASRFR
jgi:hypothetical protein